VTLYKIARKNYFFSSAFLEAQHDVFFSELQDFFSSIEQFFSVFAFFFFSFGVS